MDLKLINGEGKPAATVAGSDALFARDYNEPLIHQLVTAFQANARSGNRKQKGRADINKSHKKPWAQKGTGRARAGQANSPLWRGGGKIFPSSPDENFSHKVNRKMYRAGLASILSQLVREDRLVVVESALDAMSFYQHDQTPALVLSFGGGLSPEQGELLHHVLTKYPAAEIVTATDADEQGEAFAALILSHRTDARRARPPTGKDWNDALRL